MLSKEILYNTIIKFFLDNKKELIDKFNSLLLKQLSDINCNKFEVVNNFSNVITRTFNACYEKMLKSYKLNEVSDIQINSNILINNILDSIHSCFKTEEDYKKIIPVIKNLTEEFSYSLIALYKVANEHLVTSNIDTMKIS